MNCKQQNINKYVINKYYFLLIWVLLFLTLKEGGKTQAQAEAILNPTSRHQQYSTYGLFFEQETNLLYRSGGRPWAAIGGVAPLVEVIDQKWRPQYSVHASANVGYDFTSHAGGTLYTQTIDARVGLFVDLEFDPFSRGTIFWTHQSGHVADNVPDLELFGPDLGNEIIGFRYIHDIEKKWRMGATLRPYVITNPSAVAFGAEQFIEWFPTSCVLNKNHLCPFISGGLEQYGSHRLGLTAHFQMGFVAGDHFSAGDHNSLRFVIGGYNGADPRLKYFQMKNQSDRFFYSGILIGI